MSGQTVFETPITENSDNCFVNNKKNCLTALPRLSDVFRDIITRKEVENLVKQALSVDHILVDYHLRPYSEEKLGFLGSHLCLILVTKKSETDEYQKYSYFVKTIPYDVPTQATYIEEKGCFEKEANFFRYLVPLMMENYKGDSWSPNCYLIKQSTLVFEDMKLRGFSNKSRFFDEKTMRSAVACIARFHACSLLAEERLHGTSLNKLYPEFLKESEFDRKGQSYIWYSKGIDLAVALAEELGLNSSFIRLAGERLFDICKPSKTKRNVISHGDLWSNNMIFDGFGNCQLVDFQLIRYAPLAHDVMQLLYLTSTREFRKRQESQIIEYYYATLKENLASNNYKGTIPDFEEILQCAEEQRLPALITAMLFHPTVLMDNKSSAKIMNDTVTYEAYYFKDRKPFVDDIMATNKEYEKSIKETVKELVEMSLMLDSIPRPT